MSKIQEALKKLQGADRPRSESSEKSAMTTHGRLPKSVIPIARKKNINIGGEKHHLNEGHLIRGGLLAPLDHAIPVADEFRRIKRPLIENALKSTVNDNSFMNVIMVASALPGSGKTFCAVNLAASMSLERELNVMLIDADVAKPHVSKAFGLGEHAGLLDILEDETRLIDEVLVRTDLNDIQVLPAGRKHTQSTELLASDRMADVIKELATRYSDRIIIMDSPPLLLTSEAQALAKQAGQIALVIESGKTLHQEVLETLETLDQSKPINVILNKSIYTQPGGYYGGGYGYYGFNEED
ncbi:MAG: XrtA-associated tyrosine autokinase [Gammaproteobacteria bacterium]|nr:XrtA-associated tyrosine autokinase [Gammaproteobacteria bacterium]